MSKNKSEIDLLAEGLNINENSLKTLVNESNNIFSKSMLDLKKDSDRKTGLVIGHIQSGKTLSFTTVSCLARDNNFPLIVVIAGTSINLLDQTADRLKSDLRLDARSDRKWALFKNPVPSMPEEEAIENCLQTWKDDFIPINEKQTALIIIMKHPTHINNFSRILERMDSDLKKIPAIMIDDEGDQAGLNTNARQDKEELSTIYDKLSKLRNKLPYHTYLQYTATPQALLLIELIDHLSPEFVQLLTPGGDYIGGSELFSYQNFIETIPDDEIPSKDRVISSPPQSLVKALKIFYTSVAIAYCKGEAQGNRSMMIHPSRFTDEHARYFDWVISIKKGWLSILRLSETDQDRLELIKSFKIDGYEDLKKTVKELPDFIQVEKQLKRSIQQTSITEFNATSGSTPKVDWNANYSHILVGGQSMDRGYTVEGLTVTYMPRGPGVGNADTIQQRARFYGYKKNYLEYCRVFLENNSLEAFKSYIEHEDSLRNSLCNHIKNKESLKDWKRVFFLDKALKPTRRNVLATECRRRNYEDKWFEQKIPCSDSMLNNKSVVESILKSFEFQENPGSLERSSIQKHLVSNDILLRDLYQYLTSYRMSRVESHLYMGALLQIESFLQENCDEACIIYLMSSGQSRKRGINDKGKILELFQGEAPVRPKNLRGSI